MRFIATTYLLGIAILLAFASSLDKQDITARRIGVGIAIGIVASLFILL